MKVTNTQEGFLAALILACSSMLAHADGFDKTYQALEGDFNGDGHTDFHIQGDGGIVLIFGEISIPITLPTDVQEFVLLQDPNTQTFTSIPVSGSMNPNDWNPSTVELIVRDINFDGVRDLLVRNVEEVVPGADDQIIIADSDLRNLPVQVTALELAWSWDALTTSGVKKHSKRWTE